MRRDLELFREILMQIESFEPNDWGEIQTIGTTDFSGTPAQNYYHVRMLIDDGFLTEAGPGTDDGNFYIHGMTLRGHDFLDALRSESIWLATKARLSQAGAWTLELALEIAKEELKRRFLGGSS